MTLLVSVKADRPHLLGSGEIDCVVEVVVRALLGADDLEVLVDEDVARPVDTDYVELRLGVLQAQDPEAASRRLSTYQLAQRFEALTVDEAVSEAWALLVSRLRAAGRKVPVNDSWIAATAIAHRVPIVTQDSDYDAMPDVQVIKI